MMRLLVFRRKENEEQIEKKEFPEIEKRLYKNRI